MQERPTSDEQPIDQPSEAISGVDATAAELRDDAAGHAEAVSADESGTARPDDVERDAAAENAETTGPADADSPAAGAETAGVEADSSGAGVDESAGAVAEAGDDEPGPTGDKQWYVLKVQSGREDTIRESLQKHVSVEGLDDYFGEIIVPTEKVSEIKGGKKRVTERKLYPGYIMVNMEINDRTWFVVRETPGVGDFTGGGGHPLPMEEHEVQKMLGRETAKQVEQPRLKIDFQPGEQVKVKEGTFENFEGTVDSVDEASGRITVMINIFGRSTPVELEYWQVETV